jgi:trans-aconitate methyltransferase
MFETDKLSGAEALMEAQKIAFAPVIFQTARLLQEWGIFELLHQSGDKGLDVDELVKATGVSEYGIKVLCESGYSMGALKLKEGRYFLTRVGYFLQYDEMTKANFDFNQYVNYLGLNELGDAIKTSTPAGLHSTFNEGWETIYPYLSKLPSKAKESWFGFDHFYSDAAFATLVEIMTKRAPKKLLDVGGNTGKWTLAITQASPETEVTILDHPGQIEVAFENAVKAGVKERVNGVPMDLLDHSVAFPTGFDVVWMSQFLDCFPPEDIINLLKRAAAALNETGRVHVIEPYWDRQSHEIGAYCLINTSPYFTALANGTSKMYSAEDMHEYIQAAGLEVDEEIDGLGFGHTMTICKKKS